MIEQINILAVTFVREKRMREVTIVVKPAEEKRTTKNCNADTFNLADSTLLGGMSVTQPVNAEGATCYRGNST